MTEIKLRALVVLFAALAPSVVTGLSVPPRKTEELAKFAEGVDVDKFNIEEMIEKPGNPTEKSLGPILRDIATAISISHVETKDVQTASSGTVKLVPNGKNKRGIAVEKYNVNADAGKDELSPQQLECFIFFAIVDKLVKQVKEASKKHEAAIKAKLTEAKKDGLSYNYEVSLPDEPKVKDQAQSPKTRNTNSRKAQKKNGENPGLRKLEQKVQIKDIQTTTS